MKFPRISTLNPGRITPALLIFALTAGPAVPIVLAATGTPLPEPLRDARSLILAQFEATTPAAPATPGPNANAPSTVQPATGTPPNAPVTRMMTPVPDPAPDRGNLPSALRIDPTADATLLQQAFTAASRGDWNHALQLSAETGNMVVRDLIQWRFLLEDGSDATFDEVNQFLETHPRWPRHDAMLMRAEKAMPYLTPAQVIAWYGSRKPLSGPGTVHLGEALLASGRTAEGAAMIQRAWIQFNWSPPEESNLLAAHGDLLGPEVQKARLDYLLAHDDTAGAKHQLSRVGAAEQRLANARLQIKANPANVKTILAGLPESQQADSEFMFDVSRALRRHGDDDDAWVVMEKAPVDKSQLVMPERWSAERQIMARDAMKNADFDLAYRFASQPELDSSSGASFQDGEFLAGWIALRYLHKPDLAGDHFRRLANGVTYPISVARAHYWLGRTAEATGDFAHAAAEYAIAAEHPATFYGQLAVAKIAANPVLRIADATTDPAPADRAAFEKDDRVQAIRLLAQTGDRVTMRQFVNAVANDPPLPGQLQMLAQLVAETGDIAGSVRVAKTASFSGYNLVNYLHPVIALPGVQGGPEPALVLAIARQESEFDPGVVSGAGARGLMQVIPASAKRAADALGLRYRPADLTGDPNYNIRLGMQVLSEYLDRWDGSYILAIATYNAGPGNVQRWIDTYGDPRTPGVDPVDWIESIPFPETRNYVQRVLENVEVYRNRLGNSDRPLSIIADLYRPGAMEASSTLPIPVVTEASTAKIVSPAPDASPK
jgi:soluble lytic murein transglycosylase